MCDYHEHCTGEPIEQMRDGRSICDDCLPKYIRDCWLSDVGEIIVELGGSLEHIAESGTYYYDFRGHKVRVSTHGVVYDADISLAYEPTPDDNNFSVEVDDLVVLKELLADIEEKEEEDWGDPT